LTGRDEIVVKAEIIILYHALLGVRRQFIARLLYTQWLVDC